MSLTEKSELLTRGKELYDIGNTILYASKVDPRFCWMLYVPPDIHEPGPTPQLIVSVHGTGRNVADYCNWFSEFGQWNRCVILAPLFPAGSNGDGTHPKMRRGLPPRHATLDSGHNTLAKIGRERRRHAQPASFAGRQLESELIRFGNPKRFNRVVNRSRQAA